MQTLSLEELEAIARANIHLPEALFFAYQGVEIIEFNQVSVELVDGEEIAFYALQKAKISLSFDR